MVEAVGNLSYNQLVEKIIKSKEENSEGKDVSEGLFLIILLPRLYAFKKMLACRLYYALKFCR